MGSLFGWSMVHFNDELFIGAPKIGKNIRLQYSMSAIGLLNVIQKYFIPSIISNGQTLEFN